MKDYRNFVIVNNGKKMATTFFANCSSTASIKLYNNIDSASMLKLLNKHLSNIKKWKAEGTALNVYYILIPPKLCKLIKSKDYKVLLKSDRTSEEEKNQWGYFETIYKEVFADVVFKPNNTYDSNNINKAYRHIVYTKKLIDKMYVILDKDSQNLKQTIKY